MWDFQSCYKGPVLVGVLYRTHLFKGAPGQLSKRSTFPYGWVMCAVVARQVWAEWVWSGWHASRAPRAETAGADGGWVGSGTP